MSNKTVEELKPDFRRVQKTNKLAHLNFSADFALYFIIGGNIHTLYNILQLLNITIIAMTKDFMPLKCKEHALFLEDEMLFK